MPVMSVWGRVDRDVWCRGVISPVLRLIGIDFTSALKSPWKTGRLTLDCKVPLDADTRVPYSRASIS